MTITVQEIRTAIKDLPDNAELFIQFENAPDGMVVDWVRLEAFKGDAERPQPELIIHATGDLEEW